ncbi:uncharacterized protein [Lepeophtheirus salmonis]|uniref:uncharacterized protein n=1 Tax=Lepeophtheirus salmonis TaxID=72036 RepID=UPI001AE23BA2|nr:calmodulin-like [Lepeophtheirus salmonis]
MMGIARRRREQERKKNIEELFNKADVSGNGRLTIREFMRVMKENDVNTTEEEARKICDKGSGDIKLPEFIKFALGTDLGKVEFVDRVFSKGGKDIDEDKIAKKDKKETASKMDKVEYAFRKFDLNKDGFLSREEFELMMKNVEKSEVNRIFKSCDAKKDGRISLQEFRNMLDRNKDK